MFLFIVSFIIFTFTNTFFHNIKISILTFIFCLIFLTIFLILKYKNKIFRHSKYFLILFGSFIFSLLAIVIKDYNYSHELVNNFINPPVPQFGGTTPTFPKEDISYLIGTGKISDTYSYGKYIFQDKSGDEYILNTDKNYQIGDKLRMVGYQKKVKIDNISNYSGIWNWEFDYDKWLIMKGYRGNIYEGNSIVINENGENDFSAPHEVLRGPVEMTEFKPELQVEELEGQNKIGFINNIKRSFQSRITSTYGENKNAGLILGMLIGDKSQIPKSDYKTFVDSGLVHLIAVSGGNIIMLIIFFSFVLFFLPFYFRNFVILLIIILYSFVCGLDSSVLRAVLFSGLTMMALFVGRENNFWRSVGIVFVFMLLINPYFLLYDLGFLLSFGAVMGIKIFNKNNKKILDSSLNSEGQTKLKKLIYRIYNNYIKPSIGANLGIFPIIIFFMGQINLVGFVTNIFVLPIVPFVMIYGFISIFLYSSLKREPILYIQNILIDYIYKVSEIGSNYGIYLSVSDYKIKYLILIFFVILLIIYLYKNKINFSKK